MFSTLTINATLAAILIVVVQGNICKQLEKNQNTINGVAVDRRNFSVLIQNYLYRYSVDLVENRVLKNSPIEILNINEILPNFRRSTIDSIWVYDIENIDYLCFVDDIDMRCYNDEYGMANQSSMFSLWNSTTRKPVFDAHGNGGMMEFLPEKTIFHQLDSGKECKLYLYETSSKHLILYGEDVAKFKVEQLYQLSRSLNRTVKHLSRTVMSYRTDGFYHKGFVYLFTPNWLMRFRYDHRKFNKTQFSNVDWIETQVYFQCFKSSVSYHLYQLKIAITMTATLSAIIIAMIAYHVRNYQRLRSVSSFMLDKTTPTTTPTTNS